MNAGASMRTLLGLSLLFVGTCSWNAAGMTGCQLVGSPQRLPAILRETSGVAWSRSHPGVLFSHNDSGDEARIFALDVDGRLLGEIPLARARNRDWEDLATADCAEGSCIYLADTGDNGETRNRIFLYRVTEPATLDGSRAVAEAFPMALPDGPRDIEAMIVLPGEQIFFISKGRRHAATLYRYPPPLRPGVTVTLEAVQSLSEGSLPIQSQVTGADVVGDGSIVAVRTYRSLMFFEFEGSHLVPVEGWTVSLSTLDEPQGEGVAVGADGRIVLTSEGLLGRSATLRVLQCDVGDRSR